VPSLFFQDFFRQGPPLTSLFIEYVAEALAALPEDQRQDRFIDVIAEGLLKCELTDGTPSPAQVVEIATRLEEHYKAEQKPAKSGDKSSAGKSFLGYLIDWAAHLDMVQLSLYASDFNPVLARQLYCEVDQALVVATAHDKLRLETERARAAFEAALFGFGGRYKDTPSEHDRSFDLTADDASAEVMLKSLGF
jgi:hypothetical protein